ncbi:MAG: T9SS type A sorting domain-containing protein [Bacteroidota bacterium]
MRLVASLLALLVLVPVVSAQDATQDIRLRLVSNDATDGGNLVFAVDVKTDADRAPNTSLGSATIDIAYDDAHLTPNGFTPPTAAGYSFTVATPDCSGLAGKCIRFSITSSGIGTGFGENPGFNVGTAFTELATISLGLDATSAVSASLLIDRSTLSVGYYDSANNSNDNNVIEDNTGTVGDDVVAFETVADLSVRTAAFLDGEAWYLGGMPGSGATLNDLVSPFWTQGFSGADGGTNGSPNVVFWDETAGAYAAPGSQSAAVPAGAGLFFYVFADDDNDGTDESFPKSVTVGANPANDQGGPVNNITPDPFIPTLPFTFATTYTDGSGAPDGDGWNLLSNPTDENADWDDAGWTRTNFSTALYTWNGTAYRTWTPGVGGDRGNGVLTPFEGFWTKAMAASPVLTMPSGAYDAVVPPSREATPPTVRLRVAGDVNGLALEDEVFVAFLDGADSGLDIYDAHELLGFTDTQLHLFTELETGETFTTDVRPSLDKSDVEIALDVEAMAPGDATSSTFTLTWPELRQLDASTPVQLLDLETETVIDLWTETEYTFSLSSTASRTAEGKETSPNLLALRGPQALRAETDRSARSADRSRFLLFVGSEARMPVSSASEEEAVFELATPAPNPTHAATRLRYSLAEPGEARVAIYDMLGRSVTIAASGLHDAGRHDVVLDTGDLAPGMYVVRLEADGQAATQSLTVVR